MQGIVRYTHVQIQVVPFLALDRARYLHSFTVQGFVLLNTFDLFPTLNSLS